MRDKTKAETRGNSRENKAEMKEKQRGKRGKGPVGRVCLSLFYSEPPLFYCLNEQVPFADRSLFITKRREKVGSKINET